MPFYEYNDPTKLDKKKYDEYKEALTGSPITDSKSFQVLLWIYILILKPFNKSIHVLFF